MTVAVAKANNDRIEEREMNCWHIYCSDFAGALKGVKMKEMLQWPLLSCFAVRLLFGEK